MDSRREPPTSWQRIGRLLPRALRTRTFEPAYHDLVASFLEGDRQPGREGFRARVVLMFLDCVRVGVSGLLVRDRRPTRAFWTLLFVVGTSILLGAIGSTIEMYHTESDVPR